MDLAKLPAVLWRWRWLVVAVIAVTVFALGLRLGTNKAPYQATVRIQISEPQDGAVPLADTAYRPSSNLRDDLLLVQNDFLAVLRSPEVQNRTLKQLHLAGQDRSYAVAARPLTDSDFIDLQVSARTPALAQAVANAHAAQAIQYYGELRAKPAAATRELLDVQVQRARDALPPRSAAPSLEAQQAQATYQSLLKEQADAVLAEATALQATNIQLVAPATVPTRQAWVRQVGTQLGLSVVGSLGLGILLALLLESILPPARRAPDPLASHVDGHVDRRATSAASRGDDQQVQPGGVR